MDVRLRKAFRYPDDLDDQREELDEEEQERVIQRLQGQNEARNAQYSVNSHPHLTSCSTERLSGLDDLHWNSIILGHRLLALDAVCLDCR